MADFKDRLFYHLLTIYPVEYDALEEAKDKEREARDAVVDQVEYVDASSSDHGKTQEERAQDNCYTGEDVSPLAP